MATEAATATIDWAFQARVCDGIDTVIFGPLNPGSSAVALKIGMKHAGTMSFGEFLPEQELGRNVLEYEIWRPRKGACLDFKSLLFQSGFKSGLLVSAGVADEAEALSDLVVAARLRRNRPDVSDGEIELCIREAFRRGLKDCRLDVYHISRTDYTKSRPN